MSVNVNWPYVFRFQHGQTEGAQHVSNLLHLERDRHLRSLPHPFALAGAFPGEGEAVLRVHSFRVALGFRVEFGERYAVKPALKRLRGVKAVLREDPSAVL